MKKIKIHLPEFIDRSITRDVRKILESCIDTVDATRVVKKYVKLVNSKVVIGDDTVASNSGKIVAVGIGKAAFGMMKGLKEALRDQLRGGFLITKTPQQTHIFSPGDNISIRYGDHPLPGEKSNAATGDLLDFLKDCNENDLVICLISGGASSLMTFPIDGVSLEDIQSTTKQLLNCGATIHEINTIRKHLDQVKGGGLIKFMNGARIISLIISDVIGDPLPVIASGPTAPDTTTFRDAHQILEKYHLQSSIPSTIKYALENGMNGKTKETLKPGDPVFSKVDNLIIASNSLAVKAAIKMAIRLGYDANSLEHNIMGEARDVGAGLARDFLGRFAEIPLIGKGRFLIGGGETTVTKTGNGLGGRNLEVALGAVTELRGNRGVALITFATDGEDGPTDAAGAIVTNVTFEKGMHMGLIPDAFLENNDSYHYFAKVGGLIKTGSTGTNVMDLILLYSSPA